MRRGLGSLWGTIRPQGCTHPPHSPALIGLSKCHSLPLPLSRFLRQKPAALPGAAGTQLRGDPAQTRKLSLSSVGGAGRARGACTCWSLCHEPPFSYMQTKRFLPPNVHALAGAPGEGPGQQGQEVGLRGCPGPGLEGRKRRREAWEWGARERPAEGEQRTGRAQESKSSPVTHLHPVPRAWERRSLPPPAGNVPPCPSGCPK